MHLSPNLDYPWLLKLSAAELTLMQMVLRGDELTEEEEASADHLSATLDKIRPLAEASAQRAKTKRNSSYEQDDVSPGME